MVNNKGDAMMNHVTINYLGDKVMVDRLTAYVFREFVMADHVPSIRAKSLPSVADFSWEEMAGVDFSLATYLYEVAYELREMVTARVASDLSGRYSVELVDLLGFADWTELADFMLEAERAQATATA